MVLDNSVLYEKPFYIPVVSGLVGLLLGCLLITLVTNKSDDVVKVLKSVYVEENPETVQETAYIKVDIGGAVNSPGVYELSENSRLADLVKLSGGISNQGSAEWAAKNLNLSKILSDAEKIYIPFEWEVAKSTDVIVTQFSDITSIQKESSSTEEEAISEKINVNICSQDDLESLPGVGPVTAQRILSNRPYIDINDMKEKAKLSQSVVDKIKDLVRY